MTQPFGRELIMTNSEATYWESDEFGWPRWPQVPPLATSYLDKALNSGRWSVSGFSTGKQTLEQLFAQRFAGWAGSEFCIPTVNCTAALTAALEALEIGPGDEVITPGLTWVAPAVAVLQVGATPILVDVDPETLSISAAAIEASLGPRTRAVIAVHLYCSAADLDAILSFAKRVGIAVIEDCAQSHGTTWANKKLGTFGDVGVFSMHQGKLLTSGEGGAAITNDRLVAERMGELRANGRRYMSPPARPGCFDLMEVGSMLGSNLAMSEFHAALLIAGLEQLDAQNAARSAAATFLDCELAKIPGLRPIGRPAKISAQSYYHYLIRVKEEEFRGRPLGAIAKLLSDDLRCPWQQIYVPMNRHPLYMPLTQKRYATSEVRRKEIDPTRFHLPQAENAYATSLIVPHRVLLADKNMLARIPEAFERIRNLSS